MDKRPAMRETRCRDDRRRGRGAVGDLDNGGRDPALDAGLEEEYVSGVVFKEPRERAEEVRCRGASATGSDVQAPSWRALSSTGECW